MIIETAQIVSISENVAWVKTTDANTCGSCQARIGCGQSLLAKLGRFDSLLAVELSPSEVNQAYAGREMQIGIQSGALLGATAIVYLIPLGMLMLSILVGGSLALPDLALFFIAVAFLFAGGVVAARIAKSGVLKTRFNPRFLSWKNEGNPNISVVETLAQPVD